MSVEAHSLKTYNLAVGYTIFSSVAYPDRHNYSIVYLISYRSTAPFVSCNQHMYTIQISMSKRNSLIITILTLFHSSGFHLHSVFPAQCLVFIGLTNLLHFWSTKISFPDIHFTSLDAYPCPQPTEHCNSISKKQKSMRMIINDNSDNDKKKMKCNTNPRPRKSNPFGWIAISSKAIFSLWRQMRNGYILAVDIIYDFTFSSRRTIFNTFNLCTNTKTIPLLDSGTARRWTLVSEKLMKINCPIQISTYTLQVTILSAI